MAKLEITLRGDIDAWAKAIEAGILNSSFTASMEDRSDFRSEDGKSRCVVLVFERYSMMGENRVSMNVTLFQDDTGAIQCSGITSGGSQAAFFKFNTIGEESFLDRLREIVEG